MDETEIGERLSRIEADMKTALAISRRNDYQPAIWASWIIAFCVGLALARVCDCFGRK
jgi:hypothetical protein